MHTTASITQQSPDPTGDDMNAARALIHSLRIIGAALEARGDELVIDIPATVQLSAGVADELRARKSEIIRLMLCGHGTATTC